MRRAYVFDAYGTLLDIHAAVRCNAHEVGPDFQSFSDLWRAKQLEYSWTRTLMGAYHDFWMVTQEALDYVLLRYPAVDKALRSPLLDAYLRLNCYPEVPSLLRKMKEGGTMVALLSNGSPTMLQAATASAGLSDVLDEPFSVDNVRSFKPHPAAYTTCMQKWQLHPREISFVSSNRWDIAGANMAGFRTIWLKRSDIPDEYKDLPPAKVIGALNELLLD